MEPNENGQYNCLDCSKEFPSIFTVKVHFEKVHRSSTLITSNSFICKVCQKSFEFEEYMKCHMRAAHMLPMKIKGQ